MLRSHLVGAGADARAVVWKDASVHWDDFDLVVVRCCWDYHRAPAEFARWAESLPRLANPASSIVWNIDKRYLVELSNAGVPVVETLWLHPDIHIGTSDLPRSGRWVVKPSISLAGLDSGAYRADDPQQADAMRRHVDELLGSARGVMLQPYVESVRDEGELSLVYIDGQLSHAVRRRSTLTGPRDTSDHRFDPVAESDARRARPTAEQQQVASGALEAGPAADHLFARVDLVTDDTGATRLLELELIEPQLFLALAPAAAPRLVSAILSRARRPDDTHPAHTQEET